MATLLKTSGAYENLRKRGLSVSEASLPVIAEVVDAYANKLFDELELMGKKVTGETALEAMTNLHKSFAARVDDDNDTAQAEIEKPRLAPYLQQIAENIRPEVLKFASTLNDFIYEEAKIILGKSK